MFVDAMWNERQGRPWYGTLLLLVPVYWCWLIRKIYRLIKNEVLAVPAKSKVVEVWRLRCPACR